MQFLYFLGIHVYGFLIFIASFFNPKAKKRWQGQRQVFDYLQKNRQPHDRYVWFHAASLGEFEQGRPIMEALRREQPEVKILLTFFSPSGYEIRKNYAGADLVCYLPLDTPRNARKFLRLARPEKAVFIKYEFWINFLLQCRKNTIPTYVVSAIFREKQAFFKWYGGSYARILKTFQCIMVQDARSQKLLDGIGIEQVKIVGDTRFDRVLEILNEKKQLPVVEQFKGNDKLIVAGSSWAKDEDLLIEYWQEHKQLKLVIAPHEIHETHLQEIETKLGNGFVRYSQANETTLADARCLLIDSIGLLSSVYQYADIAYIGGGFGVGIHNTLEAAVYGIPVVFGTNYGRFREACELIAQGGAFSVEDYQGLKQIFDNLLADNKLAGRKAGKYVSENQGATRKILEEIFSA